MAQLISVKLSRFDGSPWGFRLQGGKDFGTPLIVQKVNGGSPAEAAGLRAGDSVIKVNNTEMFNLRHKDAQDVIVRAGNNFEMTIQRGGSTWKPSVTPVSSTLPAPMPAVPAGNITPVTKTSLAAKKQDAPLIGSGHNFSPKPFLNGTSEGPIKSIVNKQYNSPVGIYSEETIAETLSAQAEVLAGGVLGVNFKKNEKNYNAENSEVFKMVQEADKEPKTPEPVPSRTEFYSSVSHAIGGRATSPRSPTPLFHALGGGGTYTTPNSHEFPRISNNEDHRQDPSLVRCNNCDRVIVGVFVRIKEKNLHVECFKCSTCGTSLKNVGYYNINNKLYCDIHAKLVARQNAPSGMIPVTMPPGGKAPASTISAALANVGAPLSPPLSNHGSSPLPFSAPTSNNLIGPKPFGGSTTLPNLSSPLISNSGNSTLPRVQNQTATEVQEKFYYYNCLEETKRIESPTNPSRETPTNTNPLKNPNSVKSRSLAWPPPKSIEDITYPTASPLYIDPNPVLDRRSSHAVKDKRASIEACERALRTRSVSSDREYERHSREGFDYYEFDPMDRVSCPGPAYRRVELVESNAKHETRRESRRESASRASSTDSVRRSLTPTRIYQPIPKPWVATTSTGGNLYESSYTPQEPPKVCKKYMQSEFHQSEKVCERGMEQQPYREEHRAYRAEICRTEETVCPKPPLPSQPHVVHRPETPREVVRELDKEVMDLRKIKDDTTIDASLTLTKYVPSETEERQGIEGEHDLITETAEEDIGDMHVKKTTTYEKTVEVVSPREGSPAIEQIEEVESCTRRSTTKVDRQVTDSTETKTVEESAEVVSSAVDATQLIEQARRDEEERKREEEAEERRKQEEEERRRREEEERRRREEEERRKKHVSFSEQQAAEENDEEVVEMIREKPLGRTVIHEEKVTESDGSTPGRKKITKETYEEIVEEVLVQERVKRRDVEEERRKSLREQVEVHQNLRAQGRQPSLQERRIASKYQPHDNMETCKKHVQFMKQTETGPKPISEGPVPNSTPKEWKSEMVNALTTAPERSYTPLSTSSSVKELYSEETIYLDRKVRPVPKPKERPISPFQRALTIAPERPYTPLSRVIGPEDREVGRTQTPVVQPTPDGVCPPADILYGEARESYHREQICTKKMVPQPLPTPPPDYRLRDSSVSPSRSRPCSRADTPSSKPSTVGLRKPDTIPAYQRNLVAMKKGPVESQPYVPSRTPTPTPRRSKSPAQGPPEPPSYYTKAQAPKIRDDPPWVVKESHPPPSKESSVHFPSRKTVSYTVEEDTDTGHRKAEYMGSKSVHYDERQAEQQQEESDAIHAQFQERRCMTSEDTSEEKDNVCHVKRALHVVEDYERCEKKTMAIAAPPKEGECAIGRTTHVEVTLPCPLKRKPVETPTTQPTYSSSTEVRHVRYETPTPPPKKCPETGVTVLPCKAHSDHGTKAGVVVVPCEGQPSCPKSGVCVVPTSDRSGVCVSPCFGLKPGCCGQPSGSCGAESGQCDIEIPNCPESGVCVAPCADGSVCVAPCKKSNGQCLRKNKNKANLPFPQIPLPYEEESCPKSTPQACSFEPIHKPKTNLSGQLARLTAKNRDIPTVQLYKPLPQCQQLKNQCESKCDTTKSYHCETKSFYQSQSQCQTGNHCQTKSSCQDQFHCTPSKIQNLVDPPNMSSHPDLGTGGLGGAGSKSGTFAGSSAPKRGRGILNQAGGPGSRVPLCAHCNSYVRGPFITALGQIWCPDHFVCVNTQCRRPLQDIGFVEEKGQLYCEYCFEKFIAPSCNKCNSKIKGDCLNAIGKHFHPECFNCAYCGKLFGNSPFFLEEGLPYCEADWNELFTTKCFACGFPVEAGDRWVEALNNNYHSQCFNCTMCKKNLEGQSFYAKGGRPFCKNHAR